MVVLCCGTFDGLHPGHEDYFRQARSLGSRLVVVVARDETVKIIKGRSPFYDQDTRLQVIAAHPLVDEARLGLSGDKYRVIEAIRPDIVLLGYDQEAFTESLGEVLRARGLSCTVVRALPFKPDIFKSSKLYARSKDAS